MTEQSTAAAERSAHVTRDAPRHTVREILTEVAPGRFKLACVARLEAENARLRSLLGLAPAGWDTLENVR